MGAFVSPDAYFFGGGGFLVFVGFGVGVVAVGFGVFFGVGVERGVGGGT